MSNHRTWRRGLANLHPASSSQRKKLCNDEGTNWANAQNPNEDFLSENAQGYFL
jgi:hypothetical protein